MKLIHKELRFTSNVNRQFKVNYLISITNKIFDFILLIPTAQTNTSVSNELLLLTIDPPQYSGPGDVVRLQCTISDESQYSLKWTKIGNQPLPYGSVLLENGLLTLNRLKPSDSGIYVCSAISLRSGAIESEIEVPVNIIQRR